MNALRTPRLPLGDSRVVFATIACLMYAIDGTLLRSPSFVVRPHLLAAAAVIDLTIGVTLVYWLTVVRRTHAGPRTMLAVFMVSVAAAGLTLPPGYRHLAFDIRYLGVPFELAMVVLVVAGARRTRRSLAAAGLALDVPEQIQFVLGGSGLPKRAVDVVATELAIFYFALASWRRAPFVPANAAAFTYHVKNGYAALLYALVPIALVETTAVDLVVRVHYPVAANILLALDLFAGIWLTGLARAVQLRPVLVMRDEMQIRDGLRWRLDLPRSAIARIDYGRLAAAPVRAARYLRVGSGNPNVLITLQESVRAHGPYGRTREVMGVGLAIDDLAGFRRAVDAE